MKTALRKDQRGIAHLLVIGLVVVVLAAVGFAAWWVFVKNKKDEPAALQNASQEVRDAANAAESACIEKYDDEDLCTFIAAQTASPFDEAATVITMTTTDSEGAESTIVMRSDGQGNSQTTMTGDGQTIESITLNGVSYTQYEADGPWLTYGSSSSDSESSTSDDATTTESGLTDFMDSLSTTSYTKIGEEACGDLTCFKYQVVDTTMPDATLYAWFDTDEYMLRRFETSDANGTLTMSIVYQAVSIPTPSPVQDISTMYEDYDYGL